MSSVSGRPYRAKATVRFGKIASYADAFIESIATHDMEIGEVDGIHHIRSAFGNATFEPTETGFNLTAEAPEAGALNRLKHALTGPIGFIAARENIEIEWTGDHAAPALPDDLRIVTVRSVKDVTPRLRRIIFTGEDLARYDRDDQLHCRLIFQPRGIEEPRWPMLDHRGKVVWPGDAAVPTRVYTIRHIDSGARTMTIDFALHPQPGPATRWAMDARPGDMAGVLGPAAHGPKPADFLVLTGDETALPGIARILEMLPQNAAGHAFIEVNDAADVLPLRQPDGFQLHWLYRNGREPGTTTLLPDALRQIIWPEDLDRTFLWGGCEHAAFKAIHRHLRQEIGLPRSRFIFYSHWHRALSEEDIIAKGAEAYLPD